jgi:Zn-dependent protease
MLACSQCLTLVHGQELDRIAAEAKEFEAKGDLRSARECWLACLPLLPRGSKQAEWVRDHALKLDLNADSLEHVETPGGETNWFRNLRPLWTLVPFIFIYSQIYGMEFGIGFALLILVHEMGHFIDIKRRGLPADMPVFLPGLGAYVRWRALGVSLQTRAAVSLAGPAAGFIGSVVCWVIWLKTGNGLFAGLARASAWLNILNLVPVWILDGGQAALALSRVERIVLVVVGVALSVVFWNELFIVVAAGALIRVFIKDAPERASWGITTYFVMVLVLLALVMRFVPVQGGGM